MKRTKMNSYTLFSINSNLINRSINQYRLDDSRARQFFDE